MPGSQKAPKNALYKVLVALIHGEILCPSGPARKVNAVGQPEVFLLPVHYCWRERGRVTQQVKSKYSMIDAKQSRRQLAGAR